LHKKKIYYCDKNILEKWIILHRIKIQRNALKGYNIQFYSSNKGEGFSCNIKPKNKTYCFEVKNNRF